MGVLVDTSVWVEHFRNGNRALFDLLSFDLVLIHPMVIGELACGTPPAPRSRTLGDLRLLQACNQASVTEVIDFVEREQLFGMGCGLVDFILLSSALITPGARLWTIDKRLANLAERFGVNFVPMR
ncbi:MULTISPECIES: type II toxin-antitoxin system VapC family toxin [unclassified Burkholderia]|uniref:type II toxin-antitoxin system VapC family toxin n=1 Tax=unclassified Burkholderia TaxID=2613784 RepID=UPI0004680E19|nr:MULTISPECIES: type II toxin-antitoxin system VapC family toxin [unclassified Burkholderia]NIE87662.1 type II toxin-antitoxin system VapC family toxin [Burkholderia sp. Tr-860]NIF66353.1 type II toxin-antitoxin system VapC family toxin [Burkholderia sp. Cy-647]NIF70229.1 type II toxin-antitoxin system VapC family toxin [Burkholderia sp. Ap-962]NIF90437.1 type II toxin-antitoxin system VapC family toxin [Burkholderia sp. Cy-637]NIF98998.1 type II toxin-antitoxin system VapC family toxin [Burk